MWALQVLFYRSVTCVMHYVYVVTASVYLIEHAPPTCQSVFYFVSKFICVVIHGILLSSSDVEENSGPKAKMVKARTAILCWPCSQSYRLVKQVFLRT